MDAGEIDYKFETYVMKTVKGNAICADSEYELARVKENGIYFYGARARPRRGLYRDLAFNKDPLKKVDDLIGALSCTEIATNMTVIENLSLSKHGDVKKVLQWKHIYHGTKRKLLFCKGTSDDAVPVGDYLSYPCAYCGLILPEALIQVDHRQPKETPGVAVLKLIRAVCGPYAGAPSSGQKAPQISKLTGSRQELAKMRVGKHAFGSAFKTSLNTDAKKKYGLSVWGETFLTVCCMMHKDTGWEHICVNNVINLVPSCALCNGSAGKHGRIHQVPQGHTS